MKGLKAVKESINDLSFDIKAEVVIADLIENGLPQSDFIVIPDGLFRRRFKKDLTHAEIIELNNGQELVGIHLTREGLYDSLPEALFHGVYTENLSSGHDMARLSKTQKIEEKECRNFFLPFENEIFLQKVQLELSERKVLQRFSENLFNDIFPEFWNLDRSLPKDLVSKLMLFLHYAHKFAGDSELTASALEVILNEPVEVTYLYNPSPDSKQPGKLKETPSLLGKSALGVDLVCGGSSDDLFMLMQFTIGPLRNSRIEDYLENGRIKRFLDVFFDYFVPLEIIPVVKINGSAGEQAFKLNVENPAFLGFNTAL